MAPDDDLPTRVFGWWDMFVHEDDDPRCDGGWANDERSVLVGSLDDRRLTLELKCRGLDAEQMTRRSVPPSDMSLLGLVRHLAGVEQYWFRQVIAGVDEPRPYSDPDGRDHAFEVAADQAVVDDAWDTWRSAVARSRGVLESVPDLGRHGVGRAVPVREVLVHVVREYAQHLGHADLIRERIDGRVGQ